MGQEIRFAKILSVASTNLTYSVPTERRASLLLERNFLRAKEIELYFLWLLNFLCAACCSREAGILISNKYFYVNPLTILKIHFSKLLQIACSRLNLCSMGVSTQLGSINLAFLKRFSALYDRSFQKNCIYYCCLKKWQSYDQLSLTIRPLVIGLPGHHNRYLQGIKVLNCQH